MANDWCDKLGITPPVLEAVVGHRDANTYALFLVALLENGEPMTLADVAMRFEVADVAPFALALRSLQRCKPARPPVYRDGDHYHLDPHDHDLDLWAFRLGLRPPKIAAPKRAPPVVAVAAPHAPLTAGELDEAWTGASLANWSSPRLALAVLEAHGGPLEPAEVVAAVTRRCQWHRFTVERASFQRAGSLVRVRDDGRWEISPDGASAIIPVRVAVRALVAKVRARGHERRTSPAELEANRDAWETKRAAHAAELSRLSRAILVVFPAREPRAAVLVDVGAHAVTTYTETELARLRADLGTYDILAGVEIRAALRALGHTPGEQRLAELGPPQKSIQLNRRGRTLKLTTAHFVQGSCGIGAPFGDPKKLAGYVARGETTKLLRRLEADAKSLYALYQYGRLHGAVRLRWGFLDDLVPAPWVHRDEPQLEELKATALAIGAPLEAVIGSAPGWEEPWSRMQRVFVEKDGEWRRVLVDESGFHVPDGDVQRARLAVALH